MVVGFQLRSEAIAAQANFVSKGVHHKKVCCFVLPPCMVIKVFRDQVGFFLSFSLLGKILTDNRSYGPLVVKPGWLWTTYQFLGMVVCHMCSLFSPVHVHLRKGS